MDVTTQISEFVYNIQFSDLPERVVHEAKRSLVNYFATALAGSHQPAVSKSLQVMNKLVSDRSTSIIGRNEKTDTSSGAFLNAVSANVFDFDDTHVRTVIHPSAPVFPPILAMSERQPVSGKQLLLAFILGADIECRVGNAMSPAHYRRGWHITSTCGVFGSAAAIGKVMGLSPLQLTWALGNASAQSSGLIETLGTMSKSISVGNAARNGLLAALLAANDFFGPKKVFDGEYGFMKVYNTDYDVNELTDELGSRWELLQNAYKPYPCGVVLNPVIEAGIELSHRVAGRLDTIRQIEIKAHPLTRERTDRPLPQSSQEAQVSAQHCVAVALTHGKLTLDHFSSAHFNDARLQAIGAKIKFQDDPDMAVNASTVSVRFSGGAVETFRVQEARGSSANPLTDQDLENKLRDLGRFGAPTVDTTKLVDVIWSIDTMQDVGNLLKIATPAA